MVCDARKTASNSRRGRGRELRARLTSSPAVPLPWFASRMHACVRVGKQTGVPCVVFSFEVPALGDYSIVSQPVLRNQKVRSEDQVSLGLSYSWVLDRIHQLRWIMKFLD